MSATIAYQGLPGSYSYQAANLYFAEIPQANPTNFVGTTSFVEIFQKIQSYQADFGVLPLENSLAGSILANYDLFLKFPVHLIGEYTLPIDHYLMAKTLDLSKIQKVYSHPMALAQCQNFFTEHPQIQRIEYIDTAYSAKLVSESAESNIAAIASQEAAQIYNLQILQAHLQDNYDNWTRFVVLAKNKFTWSDIETFSSSNSNTKKYKMSIAFELTHEAGALSKVLNFLANQGFNLTKIESRPILGTKFEYRFYVDLDIDQINLNLIKQNFTLLTKLTQKIHNLGIYPRI